MPALFIQKHVVLYHSCSDALYLLSPQNKSDFIKSEETFKSDQNLQQRLTLNMLTTTIVVPPSNASKWQMGFNSAFKGLICLTLHEMVWLFLIVSWAFVHDQMLFVPQYKPMLVNNKYFPMPALLSITFCSSEDNND
jgi:hypothetical protein